MLVWLRERRIAMVGYRLESLFLLLYVASIIICAASDAAGGHQF